MTGEEWGIVWFTLGMAAMGSLLIVPPGLAVAWLLARGAWPGKSIVETAVTLPLVIPPVATGLILLRFLGRRSLIGGFLHAHFNLDVVFTWRAVVIATAVMSFPLFVRTARTAFEEVPSRLEQVARTLGSGPGEVFWRVSLPLAARGLSAGLVLAFARALGEFGATVMVAGNIPGRTATLALAIFNRVQLADDAAATRLMLVSIALGFGAVWASELWSSRGQRRAG